MVGFAMRGKYVTLLTLFCSSLTGQTTLSLEQLEARNPSTGYQPLHLNEQVVIQGVVNSPVFDFTDHKLLAIEDGNYGAMLRVPSGDLRLDAYRPGDDLQVQGT